MNVAPSGCGMHEQAQSRQVWATGAGLARRLTCRTVSCQAHHTEEIPATLKHWRPSLERLEDMIRDKVIQRTRGAQDQFRQMLCLFDRCNGAMTKEALRSMLARKLDVVMTDEEAEQLFMKHDKTGAVMTTAPLAATPDLTPPACCPMCRRQRHNLVLSVHPQHYAPRLPHPAR